MSEKRTKNAVCMYIIIGNEYVTKMEPLHSVMQQQWSKYGLNMLQLCNKYRPKMECKCSTYVTDTH